MSDAMDRVHSVLWHALLKFADKQRRRKILIEGTSTPVDVTIDGEVNGRAVRQRVAGNLTVGFPDQRNRSLQPDSTVLLAHVLACVPKTKRKSLLDSLPSQYAEDFANHGELQPPGDDAALECAEALISSITLRGTREQAGSVSFQVTS